MDFRMLFREIFQPLSNIILQNLINSQ